MLSFLFFLVALKKGGIERLNYTRAYSISSQVKSSHRVRILYKKNSFICFIL